MSSIRSFQGQAGNPEGELLKVLPAAVHVQRETDCHLRRPARARSAQNTLLHSGQGCQQLRTAGVISHVAAPTIPSPAPKLQRAPAKL